MRSLRMALVIGLALVLTGSGVVIALDGVGAVDRTDVASPFFSTFRGLLNDHAGRYWRYLFFFIRNNRGYTHLLQGFLYLFTHRQHGADCFQNIFSCRQIIACQQQRVGRIYRDEQQIMIAGYKNHVGLYPHPSTMKHFEQRLTDYKRGKGSVQFPVSEPLPRELIIEMVRYRKALLDAS